MPADEPDAPGVAWPALPLAGWRDTYATLHMWTQVVGKTRLALAPMENHWWQCTLYVSERGLTTTPMASGTRLLTVDFDFVDHLLVMRTSDAQARQIRLVHSRWRTSTSCTSRPFGSCASNRTCWPDPSRSNGRSPSPRTPAFVLRRGRRQLLVACARPAGSRLQAVPQRLLRQAEPGAFLLGQLRPGRHARFRPTGAAPRRRCAELPRLRHGGGVLARVQQRRLLARWRASGRSGLLRLCLS